MKNGSGAIWVSLSRCWNSSSAVSDSDGLRSWRSVVKTDTRRESWIRSSNGLKLKRSVSGPSLMKGRKSSARSPSSPSIKVTLPSLVRNRPWGGAELPVGTMTLSGPLTVNHRDENDRSARPTDCWSCRVIPALSWVWPMRPPVTADRSSTPPSPRSVKADRADISTPATCFRVSTLTTPAMASAP